MTQFSPKNVALGSLGVGVLGCLILGDGWFTGSDMILGAGGTVLILSIYGLYIAYLLNIVRFWESGAEPVAVAFLLLPNIPMYWFMNAPVKDGYAFAGSVIGGIFIILVGLIVAVWVKKQIKRHILNIDPGEKPATPQYLPMVMAMLLLTAGSLWGIADASSEYSAPYDLPPIMRAYAPEYAYPSAGSPTVEYRDSGISFTYPAGLTVFEGGARPWNSYDNGEVVIQGSGMHETYVVSWVYSGPETPDLANILTLGIDEMAGDKGVHNLVRGGTYTRALGCGHEARYIPIAYSYRAQEIYPDLFDDEIALHGYLGAFYCDRTDRAVVFGLETRGGTAVADRMLEAFLATARCH